MKGRTVELVASSWIEALGGLSRWYIFSTPPLFWASATPLEHIRAAARPPSKTIGRIVVPFPVAPRVEPQRRAHFSGEGSSGLENHGWERATPVALIYRR